MKTIKLNEFTPGPWRSGAEGNLRVYGPDYLGAQSGLVASFVRRADVRLVTAAPTMYAALTELLDLFGRPHPEEYVDGGASYKLACETVARARAALSAADGRDAEAKP